MAIGDDLVAGRGGLVGPTAFTPDMAEQGIQLIGDPPGVGGRGEAATALDEGRRQRMEGSPRVQPAGQQRPVLSPEDVRPRNPFNPDEFEVPEDDAMTPQGMLAPSEFQGIGKALKGFGDALGTPGFSKLLAAAGMAISPENTQLGELAFDMAESTAQQQFRQRLDEGESAGDILMPGLSTAGRQQVQQQFESERARGVEEELAQSQEERLTAREERLGETADLQRDRIRQQLKTGEINQEAAQLELNALQAAQEVSETADPNQMVRAAAKTFGMTIPDGVDLSGFTPEQAFELSRELAALERTRENVSGRERTAGEDIGMLSEAVRRTRINTYKRDLQGLRDQLINPTGTSERGGLGDASRREILEQQRELTDRILELGGDPFEEASGGGSQARQEMQSKQRQVLQVYQKAQSDLGLSKEEVDDIGIENVQRLLDS